MRTQVAVFKFWEKDLIADPAVDEVTERLEYQLNAFLHDLSLAKEAVRNITHTAVVKDGDIIHFYSVFFDTPV